MYDRIDYAVWQATGLPLGYWLAGVALGGLAFLLLWGA